MSNEDSVQVVVKAVDEFSKAMQSFKDELSSQATQAAKTETAVKSLSDRFGGLGAVFTGALMKMGADIFSALENGLQSVIELIPQAVAGGMAWASQIHDLMIETGMTAEQTSTLAAVMTELGVPIDATDNLMAKFGKNLDVNEQLFTALGIATRNTNGDLLDAYSIIDNTRKAIQAHGESLLNTAAAQELFGKSGYDLLPYLQLSDEQFKALAVDAGNAGVVISGQTTDAAHQFGIAMGELQNDITGIQTGIFAGLAPMLTSFVDSFGQFIQANMNNIVSFVVSVANFIGGVISELFGFSLPAATGESQMAGEYAPAAKAKTPAPQVTATGGSVGGSGGGGSSAANDPYVTAIKAETDAINDQLAALTKLDNAEQAEQKQADLQKAIADAQNELVTLQDSQVNTYGLSAAEQVKALQKRDADLVTAQDKVKTTEVSLSDWKAQQDLDAQKAVLEAEKQALADQLSAHQANAAAMAAAAKIPLAPIAAVASSFDSLGVKLRDFSRTAASSFTDGQKSAKDLKTNLGNLWQNMQDFAKWLQDWIVNPLAWLLGGIGDEASFFLTLVKGFGDLVNSIPGVSGAISNLVQGFQDLWGWLAANVPGLSALKPMKAKTTNSSSSFVSLTSMSGHATGAVFDHDQLARVGEGGEPEYLLPESKLGAFAAMAINGTRPGSTPSSGALPPIYIMVDKRILGQVVDEAIGRNMSLNGARIS